MQATAKSITMDEQDKQNFIKDCKHELPAIFKQILLLWKDSPASNSWALEKLMEVYCKNIAHNMELVKETDFISFLTGFLEDGNLVHYPDFVMNNVSYMAAEVLLSCCDCTSIEEPAFLIIRSPLHYWMATKGHRVDVTFQIYKKFIQQRRMLHLLDGVQFDGAQAFVHCLASPFNYTRKSAGDYITELIKFSHDEAQETATDDIRSRLRSTIHQLIYQFNDTFIKHVHAVPLDRSDDMEHYTFYQDKPEIYSREIVASYCRLLSDCAVASDAWCRNLAETDMFDELIVLLQHVESNSGVNVNEHFQDCTMMLLKLTAYSSDTHEKVQKLVKFLIHVAELPNYSSSCDAVCMASMILTRYKSHVSDHKLLVELSILPLFIVFSVTPQSVLNTCPTAMENMKTFLKREQKSKLGGLLCAAVNNLPSIRELMVTDYDSFLCYLELQRIEAPAEVGLPIMNGNNIRNETHLNFLVFQLSKIGMEITGWPANENCHLDRVQIYSLLNNIQIYMLACLNHRGISYLQLLAVMNCYLAALKHLKDIISCKEKTAANIHEERSDVYNRQILMDALQGLQLKMLDLDSNVRELAVKSAGELFFIVYSRSSESKTAIDMSSSMSSLWQCVDSKTEGVATEVLEFLLKSAMAGQFKLLTHLMNITEVDVISKIDHFLLASSWDSIKPVAFNLLVKICPEDVLIRYAEACLCQDNACLALTVLDFIQDLFCLQQEKNCTLEQKVDKMTYLLSHGWGDLILNNTNAANVCSFRKSSSIMAKVLDFQMQPDAKAIIDKRVSSFYSSSRAKQEDCCENSHALFKDICNKILRIHGHLIKPCVISTAQASLELGMKNTELYSHQQQAWKKRQHSGIVNSGMGIPASKMQKLECSANARQELSSPCLICLLLINTKKISSIHGYVECTMDQAASDKKPILSSGEEKCPNYVEKEQISVDDVDLYLDSTKEMPALILSTEPFASQKVIQELVLHGNKLSDSFSTKDAFGLLSWIAFKEMFEKIDPSSLQHEAQRSTDEYERNSSSIFQDFEKVLARSYNFLKVELEKELIVHFFNSFSTFLNQVFNMADAKEQDTILKDITNFLYLMTLVHQEEDCIVRFILQKRRTIWKTTLENTQGVLKFFIERLNILKHQGFRCFSDDHFASSDGLTVLLNLFTEKNIGLWTHKDMACQDDSSDRYTTIRIITDVLSGICGNVTEEEVAQTLRHLEQNEIYFLKQTFTCSPAGWEMIQAHLKVMINSYRREAFQQILKFLETLSKHLILVLYEKDNKSRTQRCSNIDSCFSQLEKWYTGQDEYDSDDDPTAVDCF